MKLSEAKRDAIMSGLNEEQKDFLKDRLKRGRRTVFANVIASQKGIKLPEDAAFEDVEHLVESWILTGYIDNGVVSSELRCECGRPLRYQYHVVNKTTGEERKFGIDHLELHTGIDAKTVAEIRSGFSKIDLELDEILLKVESGWSIESLSIPEFQSIKLPQDIQAHLDLHLPLLDRQISRIRNIVNEINMGRSQQDSITKPVRPAASPRQNLPEIEMDLFSLSPLSVLEATQPKSDNQLKLTNGQKQAVLTYLKTGVKSARIMCELLIKNGLTADQRYITEKPKVYVPVCWYIESTGNYKVISADQNDRTYESI